MSRNRESWLLSLALPHIPFLLWVKSFPFTFPPSGYFRGEKPKPSPPQSAKSFLWPAIAQNITGHPARRSHGARRARLSLCLRLQKHRVCKHSVPRSIFYTNRILACSSPRPRRQAAEQGKAAQLSCDRRSSVTAGSIALDSPPTAARMDEGRYSEKLG